jgi:hypothetical protein
MKITPLKQRHRANRQQNVRVQETPGNNKRSNWCSPRRVMYTGRQSTLGPCTGSEAGTQGGPCLQAASARNQSATSTVYSAYSNLASQQQRACGTSCTVSMRESKWHSGIQGCTRAQPARRYWASSITTPAGVL